MVEIEDYKKEMLTIDLVKANLYGMFAILPIMGIYGIPFFILWRDALSEISLENFINEFNSGMLGNFLSILAAITFGIILHELIHGITWAKFADKGFKSIRFGVLWKMMTPYCHCKEPLKVWQYILGGIMPAIILGLFPFLYSLFSGNVLWLIFSIFFTMAAVGDFFIINLLIKENKDDLVLDHPTEAGCYIFRKNEQVD